MFAGRVSKLSSVRVAHAATLEAATDILVLTGTGTTIQTIIPKNGGFAQVVFLIPLDGALTLGTSGNIVVGGSALQNKVTPLLFEPSTGKWHINAA